MNTLNYQDDINAVRETFIQALSDEFTARSGFGVYAYLGPLDINQLFKTYLRQRLPLRPFIKPHVKRLLAGA